MLKTLRTAGAFVRRHKFRFIDFVAVTTATLSTLYVGLVSNIFTDKSGEAQAPEVLEWDELLLVCTVLFIGLAWAIQRLLSERRDMARRSAAEREIRTLAFHDPLTALPNRRLFNDALKTALAAMPGADACHCVIMLDLNGFKRVNDVFGHATGDDVLIHIAARLSKAVRHGDLVARLGGDEFAVLATQLAGPEAATSLALRIIEELKPAVLAGGRHHAIGGALGVALIPQDGQAAAEILRKADIALYRAKEQRHSAMRFFEPEMDKWVHERDGLERDLRQAIEADAIVPSYQPVADLATGTVRKFDVHARWDHPRLGRVSPDRFVPIAEESGLVAALTDRLLAQACGDAATWPGDVRLAVKLSPVLLGDPGFGLRVLAIIARAGLSPRRLEFEITESAVVRDLDGVRDLFGALRQAGIKITLGNFGTGYSSLYHLRNFKLDAIKLDRSFIASMTTDSGSAAIVQALVGLGAGLGLQVEAEGIQTDEQRRFLSQRGCTQGQGDLYGAALEASDALDLVCGAALHRGAQ